MIIISKSDIENMENRQLIIKIMKEIKKIEPHIFNKLSRLYNEFKVYGLYEPYGPDLPTSKDVRDWFFHEFKDSVSIKDLSEIYKSELGIYDLFSDGYTSVTLENYPNGVRVGIAFNII